MSIWTFADRLLSPPPAKNRLTLGEGETPMLSSRSIGVSALAEEMATSLQISAYAYAPLAMAGVETIALEIAQELPGGADHVFAPAGGGGLAREEGIFSEPAGAVALAGAAKAAAAGELDPDAPVVCLVTGSEFKDAPSVDRMVRGFDRPLVDSFAECETLVRRQT